MCPLCEPCVEQAALCCSLFIYVCDTGISVFWVLGTCTTLQLQSLFLLTMAKERVSCPAFMNTSVCLKTIFISPSCFPYNLKIIFFCFLCWDIWFPEVLFLSVGRKLVLHMKGIEKNPNWYKRFLLWCFTVNTLLRVCEVLEYWRVANRSSS